MAGQPPGGFGFGSGPSGVSPFAMVIQELQALILSINNLNQTVKAITPQVIGTATSATGGAATLPANPVGFLSITNPVTGTTVHVPYYS